MDNASLVNVDSARGAELLRVLDDAKVKADVAFWAHLPEYEDWRLVLAGCQLDTVGPKKYYRLIIDAIDPAGFTAERTPAMVVLPMKDPTIRALRQRFSKTKSVEGMRLGGQLIGDRFVEDAYVYRIS